MITLSTLVIGIGIFAVILTLVMGLVMRKVESWPVSFLQNFTGGLFVFSGLVKAVDPLGTAYKMEQYFAEFEATFADTSMSFLAPLFPWLSEYVVSFSVIMIVFEIALGVMLLLGAAKKFTAWAFFLLVAFFTFLTGFTYLTGYVPADVNFFEFGKWTAYEATNMKVTDCGCFGDFLKLEPKVSFMKDLVLLVPAVVFLLMNGKMHQLFSASVRNIATIATIAGITLYCFSNYVWDLPHADFRPFKEGVNIAERKAMEEEADAKVEVIAYRITNKESGEVLELEYNEYLKRYQEFPEEDYDLFQVKTEPEVPRTKISDFALSEVTEGYEVTEELLAEEGYSVMIVAYKLKGDEHPVQKTIQDSLFVVDTLVTDAGPQLNRRLAEVREREETVTEYSWDPDYVAKWTEELGAILKTPNMKVFAATSYSSPERIADFQNAIGADIPFYTGDDIMLKTIIRSNPGVVLMKGGEILGKWHYRKADGFPGPTGQ